MPPKRQTDKWLLGQPSSVLHVEFENYLMLGDVETMMTMLPFSGPQRLPTSEQVLKLYFVFRGMDKFARSSVLDVSELVSKLILKYWVMANITMFEIRSVKLKLAKLVGMYDKLVKSKNRQTPGSGIKDKEEDLRFLEDQRGLRAGSIGARDQIFDQAVQRKEDIEGTERQLKEKELRRKQDLAERY